MDQLSKELLDRMQSTDNKMEYLKMQAVYLYKFKNKPAEEVANVVSKSINMIYQLAYRYKKFGINGLINKPRGGRTWSYLSLEEEKKLLEELNNDAIKGLVVISKIIRNKAEEKLGIPVSADYAEDLLNRHGWRKIVPRPKHPKSTVAKQEEFKKKCQT